VINFCVIGAGRMGQRHGANIARHNAARLVYVADPVQERCEAVARSLGARAITDPGIAIEDPAIDAVVIASPTRSHVDLIVAAARSGKAVLCEKPIDLDMQRVERCERELKGCSTAIMIGFHRRFDATHMALKQAVKDGEVGAIERISITSRDPQPPPANYLAESGGQFHDQMIHDFDMALWLAEAEGSVDVYAMGGNLIEPYIKEHGDTDTACVLMQFASGALCQIDCSRRCVYGYDQRVEVFGSEGMVQSANVTQTAVERFTHRAAMARDPLKQNFLQRYEASYALELDAFIGAVSNKQYPDPGFQSGKRALMLADAARASLRSGSRLRVEFDGNRAYP